MRLMLFIKLFFLSLMISLIIFAITPSSDLLFLAKAVALGTAISIATTFFYPEIRGIKTGDSVSVVVNSALPSFIGKSGWAISDGRKNTEIRVRFDGGEEAVGIIESYEGIISPPKIRLVYEEKLK